MKEKKDIRTLSDDELKKFCLSNNLAKFRAKQIIEWLWKKRATSFHEMSSLSLDIRDLLFNTFVINPVIIYKEEKSIDGTIKYSLKLNDGLLVEGVLIPSDKRITMCISSQVGCSLDCVFCATGTLKLSRNLTAAEIYDQVFILNNKSLEVFSKPISNIVFMGMGEPLLNYKNVLHSISIITTTKGLNISPKRITVSTAGISKMIKKLGDDMVRFNLAISLHATSDEKRDKLMPLNKKINLSELQNSIRYYYEKTKNRITYEYILFKDVNDSLEDASRLANFAKISPCKVNLIEYNSIDNSAYKKSSVTQTNKFIQFLENKNIIVTLRKSKGHDINAACGQLVNKLTFQQQ